MYFFATVHCLFFQLHAKDDFKVPMPEEFELYLSFILKITEHDSQVFILAGRTHFPKAGVARLVGMATTAFNCHSAIIIIIAKQSPVTISENNSP